MSTTQEVVVVPDIGDFGDIPVIEILVKRGDAVEVGGALVALESDKATMEVPSPIAGTVREVLVEIGFKVSKGSPLLVIEPSTVGVLPPRPNGANASPQEVAVQEPEPSPTRGAPVVDPPAAPRAVRLDNGAGGHLPAHASPSVRNYARELGVKISRVTGSGPKGRILRTDVQNYVRTELEAPAGRAQVGVSDHLPWPSLDFSRYGETERVELSRLKKISGRNLARNWAMVPHVTNFDEADVTALEEFRGEINRQEIAGGVKTTLLAFLVKASAATLKRFPEFNASLDGDHLILKRYYHIGFAADTPNGLVVPVIRDADRKGLVEIATEMAELAARARIGKLKPEEMQGGSFSISSLGGIGGTGFTPIINAPEVAILGAAKARIRPVWDGKRFRPRLILPIGLSWDHRAVDGASAGRFLVHLATVLGDFRWILL